MRHHALGFGLFAVLVLAALPAVPASAQCVLQDWTQSVHVSAGLLGWDLAVDGDVAVATSVEDFAPGVHHVWVWRRVGGAWVDAEPIVPLQAPQTADGAQDRVALDDGVLAIGRNDLVHVYRDDGQSWNLEAVLSFAAPGPFGRSLALEGDLLVVGRPVPGDGTVHVYRHGPSGWAAEDVLRVDDPQLFGASVAIRENEIFVGDSHDSTNGPLAGAVHRFQAGGGGWWHEQTLFGAEGAYEFGRHVAADGWWLLVEGSHEVLGAHPPVLSFFRDMQGPWLLVDTEPLPVEPQGTQSADIDLEGDLAIAGMPSVDGFAGAVASFRLQPGGVGWDAVGAVTAPQPGLGDRLGQSVALDGDRVFASAPQHDGFWSDLGHLYEAGGLPGEAWWSAVGPALAGSDGDPCLLLEGSGSILGAATLVLANAASGAPATLIAGLAQASLPFKGGTLVPTPDVFVGLVVPASGQIELGFVWPDLPFGFEFLVQAWIVDPAGPKGFAASNGVLLTPF